VSKPGRKRSHTGALPSPSGGGTPGTSVPERQLALVQTAVKSCQPRARARCGLEGLRPTSSRPTPVSGSVSSGLPPKVPPGWPLQLYPRAPSRCSPGRRYWRCLLERHVVRRVRKRADAHLVIGVLLQLVQGRVDQLETFGTDSNESSGVLCLCALLKHAGTPDSPWKSV